MPKLKCSVSFCSENRSRTTAMPRETVLGASLVIVIGSSLTVYPLAGFVEEFACQSDKLIIINKGSTALDHQALIKLETDDTGATLDKINEYISR